MSRVTDSIANSVYSGLWAVMAKWLRVPSEPPALPVWSGETMTSFRPAPEFLPYLKFWFWIGLLAIDGALTVLWIAILVANPLVGLLLFPVYLVVAILPDILVYVAIQLRYDTTWYVMTDRSLRIRRGIWIIRETTITHENVQNVKVSQGPVQRFFGIATVVVETAGGGTTGHHGKGTSTHLGMLEGLSNAHEIRDQVMARVRASRSAGLGDESAHRPSGGRWSSDHIQTLRQIRDLLAARA